MGYTHLQVRTGYSFMKSTIQVERLVQEAKRLGYDSLAITDEGVLYGAIPFYKACQKAGIKPIFGLLLQVEVQEERLELIVLAKSNEGYRHLVELSTRYEAEGKRDVEALFEPTEELFVLIKTNTPWAQAQLSEKEPLELLSVIEVFHTIFGLGNVFLALERKQSGDDFYLERAKLFYEATKVASVAIHDVRYVVEKEASGYECLRAMAKQTSWSGRKVDKEYLGLHLRSKQEMKEAFEAWPLPLQMTERLAESCHVTFSFDQLHLPSFPLEKEESAGEYLANLCYPALEDKYGEDHGEAKARLTYELEVIDRLGFSDYFLIVHDFVQFAKKKQIAVGPGRGSAAGSIVAYLLGITDVDPLKYNLLFERFLNPERVSMPDIDIDFSDRRRDEVIAYVRDKYGEDYVAQIITFGTFQARSILREVMKVMEIDEADQTYILRHIPTEGSEGLARIVKRQKELVDYIKQSNRLRTLFSVALQLEGLPRHMSIHAAGIVIGSRPLRLDVPLTKGSASMYVTQYAMDDLESIGLLKMDLLGLRNLTLIERIVASIEKKTQKPFSLDTIDWSDPATFRLLQRGETNGVFQFESDGMKRMLQKVRPSSLDDLVALNALYRPGPMQQIDTYTRRKHGQESVTYLHPDLEPILKETYGVLVYQEQIMQVAHRFASFSLGEADLLRRAISTKNRSEIESQRQRFLQGCLRNGYPQSVANQLFEWIEKFADYGFNKSHSVAYSKVAYTLAYLKANFPAHFFAELLTTSVSQDYKKRSRYIQEAKRFGISLLPPSVNHSYASFTVEGKNIRFGLVAIKGVGYESVRQILEQRKEGPFESLFDFVQRVKIKRNLLETLILAGAFDDIYDNRASLLASITPALERAELFGDAQEGSLFETSLQMKPAYVEMEDFSIMDRLTDEQELLGTYVSTHPLKERRGMLTHRGFRTIETLHQLPLGRIVELIVHVQRIHKIRTRRGDSMAFSTLTDETGEIESVIFSNLWRDIHPFFEENQFYQIQAKISERQGKRQLILQRVKGFSLKEVEEAKGILFLRVERKQRSKSKEILRTIAGQYPGEVRVIVHDAETKETYKLSKQYNLNFNDACRDQLIYHFGIKNVVFT